MRKIYSGVTKIPEKEAGKEITEGCLVLEGGAWRGLYTMGALDAMMEEDINFRTVMGISAGIPVITGARGAMEKLTDGMEITLEPGLGRVYAGAVRVG